MLFVAEGIDYSVLDAKDPESLTEEEKIALLERMCGREPEQPPPPPPPPLQQQQEEEQEGQQVATTSTTRDQAAANGPRARRGQA